jgi:hypothetical protein
MTWVKLTMPSGQPVHINADQMTCVRSDTEIPGAKAQLEFTNNKIQGVQEDIAQVIAAILAAQENSPTS